MERAAEIVRQRVLLATGSLAESGVLYAIAGDWAAAHWVARADPGAVRGCVDIEIIIRRADFSYAAARLAFGGFSQASIDGRVCFLPDPSAKPRNGIDIFFAGETVRPNQALPTPDVLESEHGSDFRVLSLAAFVRFSLARNRTLDRVHVRDIMDVGLVDAAWLDKLPHTLVPRLQHLLDTPNG